MFLLTADIATKLILEISFIRLSDDENWPWAALPVLLVAEILERQLFFQSAHAPKMPGNFGPRGH